MKAALVARNGSTALLKGGDYSGAADDPTPVSAMAERLDTEAAPAWEALIAAIMTMVDEAKSLQQLRDQLLGAFGDLDAGKLADVMAMAMAAAHLAGRYQVDVDSG
jgi:phage gp29-like protein